MFWGWTPAVLKLAQAVLEMALSGEVPKQKPGLLVPGSLKRLSYLS